MPTIDAPALAALRWHLDVAVEMCECDGETWVIVAEAAAFVAEGMARGATAAEAHRLLVVAGTCRGAAASPAREALPMLVRVANGLRDETR